MLIEGIDKMEYEHKEILKYSSSIVFFYRIAIKKKSYVDIANLLYPVISVLEHFQPYINIPEIQGLSTK
jgi:hypothetical protein